MMESKYREDISGYLQNSIIEKYMQIPIKISH